jgi:hypothetical protein
MKKRSEIEAPKSANEPPPLFATNNPNSPRMSDDYERISRSIFDVDAFHDYERLEGALVIGEDRADYATLNAALDRAEDNARVAHKLFIASKLERERLERRCEVIEAGMRETATDALQEQKAKGTRTKQITDADVRAACASMFPDEWQDIQDRMSVAKKTESHLEALADIWKSRCRSLQVMLQSLRK